MFLYLITLLISLRMLLSLYEIPSSALAPELTLDYDQRTGLMSWRFFFGTIGGAGMTWAAFRIFLRHDATHPLGIKESHRMGLLRTGGRHRHVRQYHGVVPRHSSIHRGAGADAAARRNLDGQGPRGDRDAIESIFSGADDLRADRRRRHRAQRRPRVVHQQLFLGAVTETAFVVSADSAGRGLPWSGTGAGLVEALRQKARDARSVLHLAVLRRDSYPAALAWGDAAQSFFGAGRDPAWLLPGGGDARHHGLHHCHLDDG